MTRLNTRVAWLKEQVALGMGQTEYSRYKKRPDNWMWRQVYHIEDAGPDSQVRVLIARSRGMQGERRRELAEARRVACLVAMAEDELDILTAMQLFKVSRSTLQVWLQGVPKAALPQLRRRQR